MKWIEWSLGHMHGGMLKAGYVELPFICNKIDHPMVAHIWMEMGGNGPLNYHDFWVKKHATAWSLT
jgi:hypothetical protein